MGDAPRFFSHTGYYPAAKQRGKRGINPAPAGGRPIHTAALPYLKTPLARPILML